MKICLSKQPPYADLGDGHISACWLHFMGKDGVKAAEAGAVKNEEPEVTKQDEKKDDKQEVSE